ncbi:MAG TPA: YciI family protein [Actinomycetes bacterium]
MRYMLLIFTNPENWAVLSEAETGAMYGEYAAFTQRIVDSGEFVSGDPLQGPETATTVRVRAGARSSTDGPFVETKEHLAGYYVVECASLDRALELAAEIPDAKFSGIEVRPLADMTMPS